MTNIVPPATNRAFAKTYLLTHSLTHSHTYSLTHSPVLGAFATEVAASTWEEIQKENDLDLLEKGAADDMLPLMAPEDTSETGVIRNTLASSQFFRMLGVDSEDLGMRCSYVYVLSQHSYSILLKALEEKLFTGLDNSDSNVNSFDQDF